MLRKYSLFKKIGIAPNITNFKIYYYSVNQYLHIKLLVHWQHTRDTSPIKHTTDICILNITNIGK